jgi:hypothetical protein
MKISHKYICIVWGYVCVCVSMCCLRFHIKMWLIPLIYNHF